MKNQIEIKETNYLCEFNLLMIFLRWRQFDVANIRHETKKDLVVACLMDRRIVVLS